MCIHETDRERHYIVIAGVFTVVALVVVKSSFCFILISMFIIFSFLIIRLLLLLSCPFFVSFVLCIALLPPMYMPTPVDIFNFDAEYMSRKCVLLNSRP